MATSDNPQPDTTGERLQKVLAAHGISSRRGAEEMISRGEVRVNGRVAVIGQRVREDVDVIEVNGRRVEARLARTYVALNKPSGYVTTLSATHGERTVTELLPGTPRLFPVGRLDKETSGLLLLTDDGDWAEGIMHPRFGVEKEYRALVRGRPSHEDIELLRQGVVLPDGVTTAPARVYVIQERNFETELAITVREGKKRQIRLMCAAVDHHVVLLRRIRVGPIRLGDLMEGHWRRLSSEEVESVRQTTERGRSAGSQLENDRDRRTGGRR